MRANLTGRGRTLSWLLVALAFGILLSLQLNSSPPPAPTASADGRDRAEVTIRRLEEDQEALKAHIGQLRQELAAYQQETAATTDLLEGLSAELNRQKAMAGLIALADRDLAPSESGRAGRWAEEIHAAVVPDPDAP